jgi:hypothetical protein
VQRFLIIPKFFTEGRFAIIVAGVLARQNNRKTFSFFSPISAN